MARIEYQFEAKKHAYRQTQDGIVVSFVVHPDDVDSDFAVAPLGTRYMVVAVPIGDDEKPLEKPEKTKGEKAVQRAAMLCKDREFQEWIVNRCAVRSIPCEETAITLMRGQLEIQSRSELATDELALDDFLEMEAAFKEATGRQAEMR